MRVVDRAVVVTFATNVGLNRQVASYVGHVEDQGDVLEWGK
jgi:hypothetical protein